MRWNLVFSNDIPITGRIRAAMEGAGRPEWELNI